MKLTRLTRPLRRIVRIEGVDLVVTLDPSGVLYARRKRFRRRSLSIALAGQFRSLLKHARELRQESLPL